MFRLFSVLASITVLVFAFISFFYYNDDFGWEIFFYEDLVFYSLLILVVSFLIRALIRWQKLVFINKLEGYKLSKAGFNKIFLNECLPFFIYVPISILIVIYLPQAIVISFILWVYVVEGFIHLFMGSSRYKLIINDQSIIVVRNKQHIIFWKKVKLIAFKYKGVIILDNRGNQIFLDEFDFEEYPKWKERLKELSLTKNIYIEQ
jgi:hypothetical protein